MRPYNLRSQPHYYVFTIQCYPLHTTSLQPNVTAYLISNIFLSLAISTMPLVPNILLAFGKRLPCTHSRYWRTPTRCATPGAARRTPHQTSKTMSFVLSYCFFLLCHLCYSISAELKTISREDAHLMYPRYPRVFLYMFNDLLPTPPPNLYENGLGVSLLCTCVAFSPFR